MLFLDAPAHGRIRNLASKAFTPRRVEALRAHIEAITDGLLDKVEGRGRMDVIADLADPLPAIVTAEMLGLPVSDREQLTVWSTEFAEALAQPPAQPRPFLTRAEKPGGHVQLLSRRSSTPSRAPWR
jgi:cytochrome P450